ncbi:hypothetical protein PHMEG_00015888 [Phytophthora megakarya]|uniref:DDE Tnp4 domain-containing protein n=1 Tax=Phytophthora megakarya TaxID=4795 RepID=A0A225W0L8_9STRA|nr:hypothetical protein PHMEG_00015888 [Phytophthora megakarya]
MFNTRAFEIALRTSVTGWSHDKLRCEKKSFLRIYRVVHAAWSREPGPYIKNTFIKRVVLSMLYLAKGGTMDQAATVGISRPGSVVYINATLDVLSAMAKSMISMPPAEELAAFEDGFYATAGFPDTIGAVDGTLVRIARPHDFEGWYCRKYFPAAGLHNMLTLIRDRLPIHDEDPLLQDVPAPVSEDPVRKEHAVCHQQGIAKRYDIADILMRYR